MECAEKSSHPLYGGAIKLTNGTVDVLVTTDIGPRIIFFGFSGESNVFGEMSLDESVETSLGAWRPVGGHRLWTAPEDSPRSYTPDNSPVDAEVIMPCCVRVRPAPDISASVQKEMIITLDKQGTRVTVEHSIQNIGLWPVTLAPWALTIMKGGGTTIFPQEPFAPHTECLTPARPLVLWSYTDMSDSRWEFGKKLVRLSCDEKLDYPQKIGAAVKAGWAAYALGDLLFVKRFPYDDSRRYADYGCNFETYTKGSFMEVETLGALTEVQPGESAKHTERWYLWRDVDLGSSDDSAEEALRAVISKCV